MRPAKSSRSVRTLMFCGGGAYATIKDLKDLSFLSVGVTIDMQVLKDLKRFFHGCNRGGQAPALRFSRPSPLTVGRGPVPRHASVGEMPGPAFGFRVGRTIAGDRPPRYGPGEGSFRHAPFGIRRSRTTVFCSNLANRDNLVNPAPAWLDEGQALALR